MQTHIPPTHAWPVEHAAPPPHVHVPVPEQPSPVEPQLAHAPAAVPHIDDVVARGRLDPEQQPVGHVVVLQSSHTPGHARFGPARLAHPAGCSAGRRIVAKLADPPTPTVVQQAAARRRVARALSAGTVLAASARRPAAARAGAGGRATIPGRTARDTGETGRTARGRSRGRHAGRSGAAAVRAARVGAGANAAYARLAEATRRARPALADTGHGAVIGDGAVASRAAVAVAPQSVTDPMYCTPRPNSIRWGTRSSYKHTCHQSRFGPPRMVRPFRTCMRPTASRYRSSPRCTRCKRSRLARTPRTTKRCTWAPSNNPRDTAIQHPLDAPPVHVCGLGHAWQRPRRCRTR